MVYLTNGFHPVWLPWVSNHRLTTCSFGHAVDCPFPLVFTYISLQHSYNLRSWALHFSGEYVLLPRHDCKLHAREFYCQTNVLELIVWAYVPSSWQGGSSLEGLLDIAYDILGRCIYLTKNLEFCIFIPPFPPAPNYVMVLMNIP